MYMRREVLDRRGWVWVAERLALNGGTWYTAVYYTHL